jgi:transposase
MLWNEADRERHNIVRERYTSDLSDEEYALIEPLLPQPKRRGRKPTPARTILNAIFYLARCACPWRYMPKDFPPYTTVQNREAAKRPLLSRQRRSRYAGMRGSVGLAK